MTPTQVADIHDESLLEKLAKDKNADVRRAVAQNVFSSLKVLDLLAKEFPVEVANNGRLESDIWADATAWSECHHFWHLFREGAPSWLLPQFPKLSMKAREKLVYHCELDPYYTDVLKVDPDWPVRFSLALSAHTSTDVLAFLAEHEKEVLVRQKVATNLRTPPAVLALLARDPNSFVRMGVVNHPSTPRKVLQKLASRKEPDEGVRVVAKSKISPDSADESETKMVKSGSKRLPMGS
jgi:hypothetical protein